MQNECQKIIRGRALMEKGYGCPNHLKNACHDFAHAWNHNCYYHMQLYRNDIFGIGEYRSITQDFLTRLSYDIKEGYFNNIIFCVTAAMEKYNEDNK